MHEREYDKQINRVIDYINENISKELTIKTLLGLVEYSPYHFHRIFTNFMGESLAKYVLRKRLELAAIILMKNEDTPIMNIAYDLGLLSVYHDDPNVTDDPQKLTSDAGLVIPQGVTTGGEIGTYDLKGGIYAVGRFKIAMEEFTKAWGCMAQMIAEYACQYAEGVPYEIYLNNRDDHPERKWILDICIPVSAK